MKKNDNKIIIHEYLVAKLYYNFSQHQLVTNIWCQNLMNILTFWVLYSSYFIVYDLRWIMEKE